MKGTLLQKAASISELLSPIKRISSHFNPYLEIIFFIWSVFFSGDPKTSLKYCEIPLPAIISFISSVGVPVEMKSLY